MVSDKEKKEKLVGLLDKKVFDKIIRAEESFQVKMLKSTGT